MKNLKVLQEMKIGGITLKNRILMAPMLTNFGGEDGEVSDRFVAYHRERAKGGVALIITEGAFVHQSGKGFPYEIGIHKDELIENHKILTNAVHEEGGKIAIQLYHGGRQTSSMVTGIPTLAPSPIACKVVQELPKEMTKEDIEEIKNAYIEGAKRAKLAGYDAVEVHGAHGYLINQFLSPYTNKRTDEYGGNIEKRARFALEIVNGIRQQVGTDYPIIFRVPSDEFVEGGIDFDDVIKLSKLLVDAGVDALHVSGGIYESGGMIIQPAAVPQGCYVDNASKIKEAINSKIPVIVVGRLKTPESIEAIVEEGKVDAVAMGRAFLADPYFVNKLIKNDTKGIRKCIGCNQGCSDRLNAGKDIQCLCNPDTGFELEYNYAEKTEQEKNVMIIGAGPAGLEAARTAVLKGNKVKIYDKRGYLGGQMAIAAMPPLKEEINDLIQFLANEIKSLGVEVNLDTEVNLELVTKENPDAIICATGSVPFIPPIKGIEEVITADEILTEIKVPKGNVVIIGGGLVGSETAEYVKEKYPETQVSIVEMREDVALDMGASSRFMLLDRLNKLGINIIKDTKVEEIQGKKIVVNSKEETKTLQDVDTIIFAVGYKPNTELKDSLETTHIPVRYIGDCISVRRILDAIHEGHKVAYNI